MPARPEPAVPEWTSGTAWGAALRLLAAYAVLTALLYGAGEPYSRGWSRIIAAQMPLIQNHFAAPEVDLATMDGQAVLRFEGTISPRLRSRFPDIPAGETIWAATLQAHLHNHLILVMSLLAAWPAPTIRRRCRLLLAGLVAAVASTSLDLPFALAGLALGEIYAGFEPGLLKTDALVRYFDFLQAGGRLLLPIVGAGLVVAAQSGSRPSRA
jgi:hypothetical protein